MHLFIFISIGCRGSAQIKAMKKIAAPIRVELAQYRELAAFSQFGSELDASTAEQLAQGARIKEILKQPQYKPMPVEKQVIIIYAATKKYRAVAEKAFKGLNDKLMRENADGTLTLTRCCQVGGLGGNPYRDGSFEYYIGEKMRDNDAKAIGPYIMGCLQLGY